MTPASLNPFLPPGTAALLRNLLDLNPKHRVATAGALLPAIDAFIVVEQRCLGRRNGHARRRVFNERMKTIARGFRALAVALLLGAIISVAIYVTLVRREIRIPRPDLVLIAVAVPAYLAAWLALVLGMTTVNAWILGVPGKLFKKRSGHPLWNFMMQ